MNRRDALSVLGATAAGLVTIAGSTTYGQERRKREDNEQQHDHAHMAKGTAKSCSDCANECEAGFHHCHEALAAGKKEYANAEHLCVDTATMCHCAAALCGRVSPLMGVCCQACAECCDACIAECEKLNDDEMKAVIDACRETAKACREMAKMMGGAEARR